MRVPYPGSRECASRSTFPYLIAYVDGPWFLIFAVVNGQAELLGSVDPSFSASQTSRLEVRTNGPTIHAYINGSLSRPSPRHSIRATKHGVLWNSGEASTAFDNFEVSIPPGMPAIPALSPSSGTGGTRWRSPAPSTSCHVASLGAIFGVVRWAVYRGYGALVHVANCALPWQWIRCVPMSRLSNRRLTGNLMSLPSLA